MNTSSNRKPAYSKFFNFLVLSIGCFCLYGCKPQERVVLPTIYSYQETEINQLKIQVAELEKLIKGQLQNENKINLKGKVSPIKSITFRIGSNDDRLRIYWEDGSKTDLPCTKEQSIWACG